MTTDTKKGILPKIGIATILVCLLLAGLVIPEAAKFKGRPRLTFVRSGQTRILRCASYSAGL